MFYLNCLHCFFFRPGTLLVLSKGVCTSFYCAGVNFSLIIKLDGMLSIPLFSEAMCLKSLTPVLLKTPLDLGCHSLADRTFDVLQIMLNVFLLSI